MRTKAIQSVDRWLNEADEVLAETQELALSPSNTEFDGEPERRWQVSLATFARGLPSLLERLCSRPGRWILIVESVDRPRLFWQTIAYEDGSLVAEATSATYGTDDERHTPETEAALAGLGWLSPVPPKRPNWQRVEHSFYPEIGDVADQAIRTLRDIFGIEETDKLLLVLFPSHHRGHTPASEVPLWSDEVDDEEDEYEEDYYEEDEEEEDEEDEDEEEEEEEDAYRSRPDDVGAEGHTIHLRGDRSAALSGSTGPDVPLGPSFIPTDEPWAEYYRSVWPGYATPQSPFIRWKYASSAVSIVRDLWNQREQALAAWTEVHGDDPEGWPVAHPPLIPFVAGRCWSACLRCLRIECDGGGDHGGGDHGEDDHGGGDHGEDDHGEDETVADTIRHATAYGADPIVLEALEIPVRPSHTRWLELHERLGLPEPGDERRGDAAASLTPVEQT